MPYYIDTIIEKAIQGVKDGLNGGKKLQEPDYTAILATKFPKLINASGIYPKIKFGGCFIHQSPMVKFDSHHKHKFCELGDLLVLVRKQTKDGDRFNAAILQLKMSDKNPACLKKDGDKKQLYLYEKWPEFEIVRSKKKYDILPKAVHQGALYCMIDKKTPWIYMAEPMIEMSYANSLGMFLNNMIKWQAGRSISDDSYCAGTDEWSRLVWDLIRLSLKTVFNRANIGYRDEPRLYDGFFKLILEHPEKDPMFTRIINEDGYNDNYEEYGSGISILFIDVNEKENYL